MIKKQLMILITLCSVCFMGCNDSKNNKLSAEEAIQLEVSLEQNMTSKYPLDIIFKLTNLSDKTVYYDLSSVPHNVDGESLDIFKISEDGLPLQYKGVFILSFGYSFGTLGAGETFIAPVSLDKIYKVNKGTHNYTVSYTNTILAKTSDNKTEIFDEEGYTLQANELPFKDRTSKPINLTSNTLEFEATVHKIRETE